MALQLVGLQHVNNVGAEFRVLRRKPKIEARRFWVKRRLNLAVFTDEPFRHQPLKDFFRSLFAKWLPFTIHNLHQARERNSRNFAESDATILLVFRL